MLCWAAHLKGAPKQLYFHAAVSSGHKLYSFGGWRGNASSRDQMGVHVFNTVSLRWAKLPPPPTVRGEQRPAEVPSMRYGHTAALMEDFIYIWGGYPYCNRLYSYIVDDNPRWFKPRASGTVPAGREGHSACALRKAMYIHGGWNQLTGYTNDIHKMDTTAGLHCWSSITARGTPPPASYCHSATIIETKMFVFGGVGHQSNYNGVSAFDTETDLWLSMPSSTQPRPRRRWSHSAFAHDRALYIFGGCDSNQSFSDLWRFNPETSSWRKVEPKGSGPCRLCRMCCCVVGDRVLLFGGCRGNSSPSDDLYILDFTPSLKTLCHLVVTQHYVVSVVPKREASYSMHHR